MNLSEIPIRKMSDEEIRAELAKHGGPQAYRKSVLDFVDGQPIAKAQPIAKSATKVFNNWCEVVAAVAKERKQSLTEFYRLNPAEHRCYLELAKARERDY